MAALHGFASSHRRSRSRRDTSLHTPLTARAHVRVVSPVVHSSLGLLFCLFILSVAMSFLPSLLLRAPSLMPSWPVAPRMALAPKDHQENENTVPPVQATAEPAPLYLASDQVATSSVPRQTFRSAHISTHARLLSSCASGSRSFHVVRAGETLSGIAERFGTTWVSSQFSGGSLAPGWN